LDLLLWPDSPLGSRRIAKLSDTLEKQFLPDGGHIEYCPYYHLQVLSVIRSVLNADRLRRGSSCARFHSLSERAARALRVMLAPTSNLPSRFGDISRIWSGREVRADVQFALLDKDPEARQGFLPDFGVVSRQWQSPAATFGLVADVGPFGLTGNPGHAHDDLFSFCFLIDGVEVVADPGVHKYSNDPACTWFKLANAHNVLRRSGGREPELARFFRWRKLPRRPLIEYLNEAGDRCVSVRRSGDERIGSGIHERHWIPTGTGLKVLDRFRDPEPHRAKVRLNFGPGWRVSLRPTDALLTMGGSRPELLIRWHSTEEVGVSLAEGFYSPTYGGRVEISGLEWEVAPRSSTWQLGVSIDVA
jgi:hypothetical protein